MHLVDRDKDRGPLPARDLEEGLAGGPHAVGIKDVGGGEGGAIFLGELEALECRHVGGDKRPQGV